MQCRPPSPSWLLALRENGRPGVVWGGLIERLAIPGLGCLLVPAAVPPAESAQPVLGGPWSEAPLWRTGNGN